MLDRVLLILALLVLASCSSPRRRIAPEAKQPEAEYGVGDTVTLAEGIAHLDADERIVTVGDTILVTDPCHRIELTLTKCIDVDGTVLLPELGPVQVAGFTCAELERLLTKRWAPYFQRLDLHVEILARAEGQDQALASETRRMLLEWILQELRVWLRDLRARPPILIAGGEPR